MNKSILIQSKNVSGSVKKLFSTDNIINFDYSNRDEGIKSLDEYISKSIIEKLKDKKFNFIYIKDNLSPNYLELYGLKVAYHIRLSQELADTRYVPIVILSDLDGYTLNRLEPMARILFTKNIFLEANTQETIKTFNGKDISKLTEKEFNNKFIKLIEIEPPENSSSHSIANEWAIYKWAKELKIPNNNINNILETINSQLYFKYLRAKYSILDEIKIDQQAKTISKKSIKIVRKADVKEKKILYIDDEYKKGWEDIFKFYFSKKRGYLFEVVPIDYTNKKYENIEKPILDKIIDYKPDLIILDMRLVRNDHNEEIQPEDISGIKILESIKEKNISINTELNPGIQILILTASGRSDILEKAYKDNKILGYIKKEHIDDVSIKTKDNINKLDDLLKGGEEKFYLKDIWITQKKTLQLKILNQDNYKQIEKEVGFIFEMLDSNMENNLKIAMLTIYKVLEIIKDLYVTDGAKFIKDREEDQENIQAIYFINNMYQSIAKDTFINKHYDYGFDCKKSSSKYYYSTTNKIRAIMYEMLHIKNKSSLDLMGSISEKRNKYIHPDKGKQVKVEKDDILKWLEMIGNILKQIDKELT